MNDKVAEEETAVSAQLMIRPTKVRDNDTSVRRRRKVLSEDEYLTMLGAIIRRDFFPSLARLEAQNEYLNAVDRQDMEALKSAASKLDSLEKNSSVGGHLTSLPSLSLDEFQAAYVTEDTADFEELLDNLNRIRGSQARRIYAKNENKYVTAGGARPLALLPSSTPTLKGGIQKPTIRRDNLRIKGEEVLMQSLEKDSSDIRRHYWKMQSEFGKVTAEEDVEVDRQSIDTSTPAISQYGGSQYRNYTILDTPARNSVVDSTRKAVEGKREVKRRLMRKPAVQRFLQAQTPRRQT